MLQVAICCCALMAIAVDVASAQSFFTGTATYRVRMALPAGAVLEATLEDVSRADAALTLRRVSGSAQSVAGEPLSGSSWRLVRFQGGDGAVLTPDDRSKYTLEFDTMGGVAARIDCNRGRGTYSSSGANQLRLGPLALTRAQCAPGSLHDQIVRQWGNVRSYVMKDGRLFLALMADGGIYEFEPAGTLSTGPGAFRSPVPSKGPATWTCTRAGDAASTVRLTVYETQPALAVLERDGVTRLAFQVRAASGVRYEGDGVLFWEARGEATFNWMGAESTCRAN